jgi:hypothetical protein
MPQLVDEARGVGQEGGLDAVGDVQRREDSAHVRLDRALAHAERPRDLGVGVAPRDQAARHRAVQRVLDGYQAATGSVRASPPAGGSGWKH